MMIFQPSPFLPKAAKLFGGSDVVVWGGKPVMYFPSASQAKSAAKYLRFFLRRMGKADAIIAADLGTALQNFLQIGANPANQFRPTLNVS